MRLLRDFVQSLRRQGAYLVISSTWRMAHYELLIDYFTGKGLSPNIVIGKTDNRTCRDCLRGNMIRRWIEDNQYIIGYKNSHEYSSYVILDDSGDMLYWQKDNFVQTSWLDGLQDEHVDKCIDILNKP